MQEVEVAHTPQSLGQDVLKDEPEEIRTTRGATVQLPRLRVSIAKVHESVIAAHSTVEA
jgi:hypothetical protein